MSSVQASGWDTGRFLLLLLLQRLMTMQRRQQRQYPRVLLWWSTTAAPGARASSQSSNDDKNWKERGDTGDEFHGLTEKRAENKQIASLKNERAIFANLFRCGCYTGWQAPKPRIYTRSGWHHRDERRLVLAVQWTISNDARRRDRTEGEEKTVPHNHLSPLPRLALRIVTAWILKLNSVLLPFVSVPTKTIPPPLVPISKFEAIYAAVGLCQRMCSFRKTPSIADKKRPGWRKNDLRGATVRETNSYREFMKF